MHSELRQTGQLIKVGCNQGWSNFRSKIFRASVYIPPLHATSAMADLVFVVTRFPKKN